MFRPVVVLPGQWTERWNGQRYSQWRRSGTMHRATGACYLVKIVSEIAGKTHLAVGKACQASADAHGEQLVGIVLEFLDEILELCNFLEEKENGTGVVMLGAARSASGALVGEDQGMLATSLGEAHAANKDALAECGHDGDGEETEHLIFGCPNVATRNNIGDSPGTHNTAVSHPQHCATPDSSLTPDDLLYNSPVTEAPDSPLDAAPVTLGQGTVRQAPPPHLPRGQAPPPRLARGQRPRADRSRAHRRDAPFHT